MEDWKGFTPEPEAIRFLSIPNGFLLTLKFADSKKPKLTKISFENKESELYPFLFHLVAVDVSNKSEAEKLLITNMDKYEGLINAIVGSEIIYEYDSRISFYNAIGKFVVKEKIGLNSIFSVERTGSKYNPNWKFTKIKPIIQEKILKK